MNHVFKRFSAVALSILFSVPFSLKVPVVAKDNIIAKGIDVSAHQGDINWKSVAADGVDYVMLRCGTSVGKDKNFEKNYTGAKEAGLNVGCYFYTYASSVEKAEEDAANVLSWIDGKQFEYPIYFDIESNQSTLSAAKNATDMCLTFINMLSQNGWYTGIYCNEDWLSNYLDRNLLKQEDIEIWYARWTASGNPDKDYSEYGMWQYSSSGKCAGIYGDVDLDVCYKDYPEFIKTRGYNGFASESGSKLMPSVKSGFYIKDGKLLGAAANTTVKSFLEKAEFKQEVLVYDAKGNLLSEDDLITTGTVVSNKGAGAYCTVIIKGDTDGNGKINSTDCMTVRRAFLDLYDFDDISAAAADADEDGKIGSTDFMRIRRHFLGIFNMYE